MSHDLTAADFEPFVGRTFTPLGQHRALILAAVEVSPLPQPREAPRVPFSLTLHGPRGDVLPEGLYEAEADSGPVFTLYIIPVHTIARDRQNYQAVFN